MEIFTRCKICGVIIGMFDFYCQPCREKMRVRGSGFAYSNKCYTRKQSVELDTLLNLINNGRPYAISQGMLNNLEEDESDIAITAMDNFFKR